MITLNSNIEYYGKMDKEVLPLCDALNSLPGIETMESCCGHGCTEFNIWFKVKKETEGLFFLTRCVDRRYWEWGYLWGIALSVGDMFDDKEFPIHYRLHSGPIVGELAYEQAKSLLKNMNYHLNREGFVKGYELDVNDFCIKEKVY